MSELTVTQAFLILNALPDIGPISIACARPLSRLAAHRSAQSQTPTAPCTNRSMRIVHKVEVARGEQRLHEREHCRKRNT